MVLFTSCNFTLSAFAQSDDKTDYSQQFNSFSRVESVSRARRLYRLGGKAVYCDDFNITTESGTVLTALKVLDDLTAAEVDEYNLSGDNLCPTATRIYNSTVKFNCHSYAWYSQDCLTNDVWIDNPATLINGNNYIETYTPVAGDRICYFDRAGNNIHSGIVNEVLGGSSNGVCGNANTVTVVSKWGGCGLYKHRGDQCPYTSTYNGSARSVKFYRHNHTFRKSYKWVNFRQHNAECYCGEVKLQGHAIKSNNLLSVPSRYATCVLCGGSAEIGYIYENNFLQKMYYSANGSFVLPNGIIVLEDDDVKAYIDGSLTFYSANERVK